MATTDEDKAPEFFAMEYCAEQLDPLDEKRQRQVLAFLCERFGMNLQPAVKPIKAGFRPGRKYTRG